MNRVRNLDYYINLWEFASFSDMIELILYEFIVFSIKPIKQKGFSIIENSVTQETNLQN